MDGSRQYSKNVGIARVLTMQLFAYKLLLLNGGRGEEWHARGGVSRMDGTYEVSYLDHRLFQRCCCHHQCYLSIFTNTVKPRIIQYIVCADTNKGSNSTRSYFPTCYCYLFLIYGKDSRFPSQHETIFAQRSNSVQEAFIGLECVPHRLPHTHVACENTRLRAQQKCQV